MSEEFTLPFSRRELLNYTLTILRKYNITPRKRLSQHFVIDPLMIKKFLEYARPLRDKVVLEVGAGIGTITRYLALEAKKVIAVEIDGRLVRVLRNELSNYDNIEIVRQDILKYNLKNVDIVISNTPYHISTPLLFKLSEITFKRAVLMFQSDLVKRLIANPGSPDYGRLTLTVNMLYKIEVKESYSPRSFYPPPEVPSTMVILEPKELSDDDKRRFTMLSDLTRYLFSQRNKLAYKPLRSYLEQKNIEFLFHQIYQEKEYILRKRVRDLDIDEILEIIDLLLPYLG